MSGVSPPGVLVPATSLLCEAYGLENTGVTCWWNAVFQTLLSLRKLRDLMVELEPEMRSNPMAVRFLQILRETDHTRQSHIDLLREFIRAMEAAKVTVTGASAQQCANEALAKFLDMLNMHPITSAFSRSYEQSITCSGCKRQFTSPRDNHIWIYMPQPVRPTANGCNASEFTDALLHRNSEVDEYVCDDCKLKNKACIQTTRLRAVGEIMVILFEQYLVKRVFPFPQSFTLPRSVQVQTPDGKRSVTKGYYVYCLRACMLHSGSMSSGHHWAVCERVDGVYSLNDTSVQRLAGRFTPSANVHTVVYELDHIVEA